MPLIPKSRYHKENGFTLIELIITIIIMGVAAIIIIPYFSAISHSPDPVLREKAIALGQAMMDEILHKRWDENSPNGGGPLCTNESGTGRGNSSYTLTCPEAVRNASTIGRDGEANGPHKRQEWDDVDDYNGLAEPGGPGNTFYDQDGTSLPGNLTGFSRSVAVDYIASNEPTMDFDTASAGSLDTNATDSKRIMVTVISPQDETFKLVAISCNF
jgi:MSHA pilin protein MshD